MINYTVTNDDAKKIIISRLYLIVPAALIGVAGGLSTANVKSEMLLILIPVILIGVALSVFVGLQIGKNKLLKTQFIIDADSVLQLKGGTELRKLFFSESFTIKENMMGLIITGPTGFIGIPKQIEPYKMIKEELETRINS